MWVTRAAPGRDHDHTTNRGCGHTVKIMPYITTDDLPNSIRQHLPPHAQAIYLSAFNNAWRQHAGEPDGEATVHRIAWSAVKRRYRKAGDIWVPIIKP